MTTGQCSEQPYRPTGSPRCPAPAQGMAAMTCTGRVFSFTVPGLPVPKGRPRLGRTHVYTPARTKAHERLIWACACRAMVRPIVGPVTMWLDFYLPRPEACDVDNCTKTVLDALNGTAYADDRQVDELHLKRRRSDEPRTKVVIYPSAAA